MPVMCLPQDVNIYPFETMKRHTGAFSVPLDSPTLVPATTGPVYMGRQVRANKTKPLVDEVEMLQANPHYAMCVILTVGRLRWPLSTLHLRAKPNCYYLLTCSKSNEEHVPWEGQY